MFGHNQRIRKREFFQARAENMHCSTAGKTGTECFDKNRQVSEQGDKIQNKSFVTRNEIGKDGNSSLI